MHFLRHHHAGRRRSNFARVTPNAKKRQMIVEPLESRRLLAASVLDSSFLSAGALPSSASSLTVQFSEPVLGGTLLSNYELRRAGSDGLLGNSDDPIVPLASISMAVNTATLNFSALIDDVYRLTINDTITDLSGNALDGDGNGMAGGTGAETWWRERSARRWPAPMGSSSTQSLVAVGQGSWCKAPAMLLMA